MTVVSISEGAKKVKKSTADIGSESWAAAKRAEAQKISKEMELHYFELARVLWEVYDTPIDNIPENQPVFTLWGYKTFEEYAEVELNLQRGKAYTLRKIWYQLNIELNLEPSLRDRLVALGWTKARELVRVLTAENALKWVEFAEKHNYYELEIRVKNTLDDYKAKQQQAADAKLASSVAGASFSEGADVTGPAPKSKAASTGGKDVLPSEEDEDFAGDPDDPGPTAADGLPPVTDTLIRKTFAFYPDQRDVVDTALELARSLGNTDVDSHALTMICMEFLASNDAQARSGKDPGWKFKMLALCEKLVDLDLMAVERKTNDIVYASNGFKKKVAH